MNQAQQPSVLSPRPEAEGLEPSPCQSCGACCASFRVSFYWAESAVLGIPEHYVEQVTPSLACLTGTNQAAPHCNALEGQVGSAVSCRIYAARPSPCREVQPGDTQCQRARQRYGLPPLQGKDE